MNLYDTIEKLPYWIKPHINMAQYWESDIAIRLSMSVCYDVTPLFLAQVESMNIPAWQIHYSEWEYRMLFAVKSALVNIFGNVDQIADSDTNYVNYFIRKGTVL